MLLLCSPLISEQVFFLYINPTCAHKHTHTASSLWSTRLQPCKWARERNLLLSGTATGKQGITEAVSYSLCSQGQHAIVQWGKVQHCATVWESIADHWHYIYLKHWDNGRLSSCFHTWLDCLVWPDFSSTPILQQAFSHCTFGTEPHYACVIDLSTMAAVYHSRRKIAVSLSCCYYYLFIYFCMYAHRMAHISVKKCNSNAARTAILYALWRQFTQTQTAMRNSLYNISVTCEVWCYLYAINNSLNWLQAVPKLTWAIIQTSNVLMSMTLSILLTYCL